MPVSLWCSPYFRRMFFVLSKLFYFLLKPANWLLMLLAAWLLIKKSNIRKRIVTMAIVLIVIFTNPWLYQTCMVCWQPEAKPQVHDRPYQVAILLTGITMGNSRQERFFGSSTSDRFIQAAKLYHSGVVKYILVNGGNGALGSTRKPEAFFLKEELIAQGIPASAILLENKSRNTFESARNAKPILDSLQASSNCLLVTSALHMRRSLAVYHKAGIHPQPHTANFEVLENKLRINAFIPDVSLLNTWQHLLKELAGLVAYRLTGKA